MEEIIKLFINMSFLNILTILMVFSYIISFIYISVNKNNKITEKYFKIENTMYVYEHNDLINVEKNEENEQFSVVLNRNKMKYRLSTGSKEKCDYEKKRFYLDFYHKNAIVL
jgi:hypothetical protein